MDSTTVGLPKLSKQQQCADSSIAPGEPGIDGSIGSVKDAPVSGGNPLTQITMPVANLDDVLSRVQAHGGRIAEPRTAIPGVGWYATCAEPGGLLFGLIQEDENAR